MVDYSVNIILISLYFALYNPSQTFDTRLTIFVYKLYLVSGLDKQIQELIEAVVLPMTHKERFENLGISPPKGYYSSQQLKNNTILVSLST